MSHVKPWIGVRSRAAALIGLWASAGLAWAAPPARPPSPDPLAAARIFAEASRLCSLDHGALWGVSLCGPMMLVDPATHRLVANQADGEGKLQRDGEVFTGQLPATQNVANTSVDWAGVRWIQILWPLPDAPEQRDTLLMHESFHRIQDRLEVARPGGGDNAQLDTLQGRYLMQLEWRALARALSVDDDAPARAAASDALLFRAYRHAQFPAAATDERALEYNEGLAEYTGVKLGHPLPGDQRRQALSDLAAHVGDPSFVRSFAYATGPAYGLLLDRYAPGWRQRLKDGAGLERLLQAALHVELPADPATAVSVRAAQYDGATLYRAEQQRDEQHRAQLQHYQAVLVDGPVLAIPLRHMRIEFDPRSLQPLGAHGTVYAKLRVVDDWGVLEAGKGALLGSGWDLVTVSQPQPGSSGQLSGDGWTLQLAPGWKLAPGKRRGDWTLAN